MVILPGHQKPNYFPGYDCCLPGPQSQKTTPPNRVKEVTNIEHRRSELFTEPVNYCMCKKAKDFF